MSQFFSFGTCIASIFPGELDFLNTCFWQTFVAVCPLAVVALYLSMTVEYSFKERIKAAKLACWVAWGVMVFTAIAGPAVLEAIGIQLPAFRIAGGLLLVVSGFNMLRSEDPHIPAPKEDIQSPKKQRKDIAIAPLAVPLMAGPSVLTIIISSRAAEHGTMGSFLRIVALSLVALLMYYILYLTSKGAKWLTPTLMKLSFRLSGLFLVAIGIQMSMDGIRSVTQTLIA